MKIIADKLRDSDKHKVIRKDGLIQLYPMPSEDEQKQFNEIDSQAKNINLKTDIKTIKRKTKFDAKQRADFVSQFATKESYILDIGSGYGTWLAEMKSRGYNIKGLELCEEKRNMSAQLTGSDTDVIDLDILNPTEVFKHEVDCITLFHVLEHLRNPIQSLRNIRSCLSDRGIIIIEVPNVDDLLRIANKAYADFYWQRGHLFYFNKKSLTDIIKKAGYQNLKFFYKQRYGLENLMYWQVLGKPQLDNPSHETNGYDWLECHYKQKLEENGVSDTLMVVIEERNCLCTPQV